MARSSISDSVLLAYQALDERADSKSVGESFRRFVARCGILSEVSPRLSTSELDAAGDVIHTHVTGPQLPVGSWRELRFDRPHSVVGEAIEVNELAEHYSLEMLTFAIVNFERSDPSGGVAEAHELLAAMLFRYKYCVDSDMASFPISVILNYVERASSLLPIHDRELRKQAVLHATLRAFVAVEPDKDFAKNVLENHRKWQLGRPFPL